MEATILKWHKQAGEQVKMDETVLEIATDKVDSEVPSTSEGILQEVLYKVNDVVPIGAVIARIKTDAAVQAPVHTAPNGASSNGSVSNSPSSNGYHPEQTSTPVATSTTTQTPAFRPDRELVVQDALPYSPSNISRPASNAMMARFYSPLVLNIAASEGISMTELEQLNGTGNDGRVTKKDILQYLGDKKNGRIPATLAKALNSSVAPVQQAEDRPSQPATAYSYQGSGNVEIIEMDRMRKLIAEHMVRSKHTSPHVTSFTEADVTNMVQWRDRTKKDFEKREGTRITFTPLFIEAITKCIKKFPLINSSLDGDRIILKKDIHIGMATALPSGNLIVPVIKNADQLNLVGLSKQVNSLADAARNGKLKADDTQGGTFTLTNVGTFGSLMGTPIINQPQVAILAVGAIKKRPVVIETEQGDSIAIRHMMYLSMSYDHRIVDGSLGATFLTAVAKELENFNPNREV